MVSQASEGYIEKAILSISDTFDVATGPWSI